uniref:Uncharacterized protein n=1 Tax=Dulem virus 142 TaxID=3145619 RepID=A0AAU8B4B1_9VIRU
MNPQIIPILILSAFLLVPVIFGIILVIEIIKWLRRH